ncbi:MAG: MlaD family protein, partial [Rhizomicrobium sp.]
MERHDDFFSRARGGDAVAPDAMGEPGPHPSRTLAAIRNSRWPGWIWAVPIAAGVVVAWLVIRSLSNGGADITIALPAADGVSNQTNITFRGVNIGKITEVKLTQDQKSVVATAHIDGSVQNDLVSGSKFYLENVKPTLADLSSLKSVISGPAMVLVPGAGPPTDHFTAIIGDPPEKLTRPVVYSVSFTGSVGALRSGSPVTFRGFNVGEIEGVGLSSDAAAGRVTTDVELALDAARFHIVNAAGSGDALTGL